MILMNVAVGSVALVYRKRGTSINALCGAMLNRRVYIEVEIHQSSHSTLKPGVAILWTRQYRGLAGSTSCLRKVNVSLCTNLERHSMYLRSITLLAEALIIYSMAFRSC